MADNTTKPTMTKVLVLRPDGFDGCTWYRLKQMAQRAKELELLDVRFMDLSKTEEEMAILLKEADVYLARLQQFLPEILGSFFEIAGRKPLIIDIDDRYDIIDPLSDMYLAYGTQEVVLNDGTYLWKDGENKFDIKLNKSRLKTFEDMLSQADGVIVTTFELKNYANQFNQGVCVIPNSIDFNIWPDVKDKAKDKDEVRLIWQGGASHYSDLAEVQAPLERLMHKYPNLHFYLIGQVFPGIVKNMPQDRVKRAGWINADGHGYRTACYNADIGICPLIESDFNKAKSSIKYYEYSAAGIATVARNMLPYSEDINHGKNGYLYDNPTHFEQLVGDLIDDPIERMSLAKNAKEYVKKYRNLDDIVHDWAAFIKGVANATKS
jgi:glycosyltransferase involved in cell wall biosynthesis